jgi:hypothetical protein
MQEQVNCNLIAALANIQGKLKAPKGQRNTFGNYNYRNCEDILEAVKPLLGDISLVISDDVVLVGDRVYVKATATLYGFESSISNCAFAREALTKKGMDDSQITGAASSYARKYALNGLFCIDDTKDADSFDNKRTFDDNASQQMVVKLNKYASDDHTPLELIGFIDSVKDDEFKQWLLNQFEKGNKTKSGAKIMKGNQHYRDYLNIFTTGDESEIEECKAEMTDIEIKIIESAIKRLNK